MHRFPLFLTLPLYTDKREDYDEPSFALIDTLFSLAEAYLYMQVRVGSRVGRVVACSIACSD